MARSLIERIKFGTTTIGGLVNCQVSEIVQEAIDAGGGELDPSKLAVLGVVPVIEGETLDVGAIFDLVDANYVPALTVSSGAGTICVFSLQGATDGGTRSGSAQTFTINKGLLVLNRVSGGRVARVSFTVYADFDGTNRPIVRSTAATGTSAPAALWRICNAQGDLSGGVATDVITRLVEFEVDFGITVGRDGAASELFRRDSGIYGYRPTARIITTDLAATLALIGFTGNMIGANGLDLILMPYTSTGLIATTGGWSIRFRQNSFLFPVSLTFEPNAPLPLELGLVGVGADSVSGTPLNDTPAQLVGSQAIGTEGSGVLYRAGPWKDNTTDIEYATASLQFGLDVRAEGPAALLWPNFVYINSRRPRAAANLLDPSVYNTFFASAEVRAISTAWNMYARKVTSDGLPVADATAEHVKLSFSAGVIKAVSAGGPHPDTLQPAIEILPTAAMTIATASAIA